METLFSFENIMRPVWNTDRVYFESVMFLEENGSISAPLLYDAREILAVQRADLTETFEAGRDYEYRDGRLHLTKNSRIFFFRQEELYPTQPVPDHSFPMEEGNVLWHEGHFFHDRQIAVTYIPKECDWPGPIPGFRGQNLPKTMKKLLTARPIKLVLYGDSISEGANASGVTCTSPFLPVWGQLVAEQLQRSYGSQVTFKNPSGGGMNAIWGGENVEKLVCDENPDLVIVAFGANDGIAGEEFRQRIAAIVEPIYRRCPQAEVLLIATLVPNPLLCSPKAPFYNQRIHQGAELAKFVGPGTAMVSIHELQQSLYQRKRFIDMTGNNVNHPNDFMVRLYAQTVCAALIENFGG